jgi:hypothetical protein
MNVPWTHQRNRLSNLDLQVETIENSLLRTGRVGKHSISELEVRRAIVCHRINDFLGSAFVVEV